jgi:hypothetical protein
MKQVVKKLIIIFLLFIALLVLIQLINIQFKKNKLIYTGPNYIDASFGSDEYVKNIKHFDNNISNYLENSNTNIKINNDDNHFLNIEHFKSKNNTLKPKNRDNNTTKKSTKIIGKIDQIYFINLKHRKDRLKQINKEFDKMGFPKDRIERIDADHEKLNGHIGCCKSHIKAIKQIISEKHKCAIVFEDDFVFTVSKEQFETRIKEFFDMYKDDWDIIQLASVYTSLKDTKKDNIKKVEKASTASAYIINHKFAPILLADLEGSLKSMKAEMKEFQKNNINKKKYETRYALDQNWYKLQKKSNWYLFKPYLGKQGGEASNSSTMNRNIEEFTGMNPVKLYKLSC